jgi:hypothetical protein
MSKELTEIATDGPPNTPDVGLGAPIDDVRHLTRTISPLDISNKISQNWNNDGRSH